VAVGCLAVLPLLAATPASAVTIGQVAPAPDDNDCGGQFDLVQPTVTSGTTYVVPSTGGLTSWTVTSWSTNASPGGAQMALKIFRKVADPATFLVVGHEGPHSLVPGVNTFSANLKVKPGDVLGARFAGGGACAFDAPGEVLLYREDVDLADGATGDFQPDGDIRLNATAEITPTSDFTLGKLKKKPNGTAVLTVNVPNPGELTVSGKGVKASADAVAAKLVAAGTAKLVIRAKGKKRAKLNQTGKVKVKPTITYTPTGGDPGSRKLKVKLLKR
jgi:hypothetical protein